MSFTRCPREPCTRGTHGCTRGTVYQGDRVPGGPCTRGTMHQGDHVPGGPCTRGTVYQGDCVPGGTVYQKPSYFIKYSEYSLVYLMIFLDDPPLGHLCAGGHVLSPGRQEWVLWRHLVTMVIPAYPRNAHAGSNYGLQ